MHRSFWYGGSGECRREDGWVGQWEGAKTATASLFLYVILTLVVSGMVALLR